MEPFFTMLYFRCLSTFYCWYLFAYFLTLKIIYCNLILAFFFTCNSIFPPPVLLHMKYFFQNSVKLLINKLILQLYKSFIIKGGL